MSAEFPTNADRICANAITAALLERYGYVSLTVRYKAARQAMDTAQADAQRIADGDAAWPAEQQNARPVAHHQEPPVTG